MSQHDPVQKQSSARLPGTSPKTQPAAAPLQHEGGGLREIVTACAHLVARPPATAGTGLTVRQSLLGAQRRLGNRQVGHLLRRAEGTAPVTDPVAIERSIGAARGGGHGLDHGTRTRMEGAFGADFGGVRVHTDARADQLGHALSARAFATGRDVFFRQGEYNPGTTAGRELLAHELTHVLQQDGQAVRAKLTVSEPGDAHELEADAAARAVIAAETAPPVERGSARVEGQVARRVEGTYVHRDRAQDLSDMAEAGEANAVAEQKANVNQPPIGRMTNVGDVGAARELVEKIEGYRAHMQEGAGAGGAFTVSSERVTPAKMAANEVAISTLDDYLVTAGEQGRTLGSFQDSLRRARTNYERLKAQVTHLVVGNAISGGTSTEIGQQIVKGSGFADPAAAQERMKRLERNPALLAVHNQVQDAHKEMVLLGQETATKQNAVSQSSYGYNAALNSLKDGLPTVNDNPEQAAQLSDLKGKIEKVKKYVGMGLTAAAKVAKVPEKAQAAIEPAVGFLTDQYFDAELNGIQSTIAQYNSAHREHAINADLNTVRAASRRFTGALTDFNNSVERFAAAQADFRQRLVALGRASDGGGGGDRYARIAAVLAEVDTYVTQLDNALSLAFQEQSASREAAATRRAVEGGPKEGGRDAGTPYFVPYRWYHANGGWSYQCSRNELSLGMPRNSAQGAEDVGVNATVERAVRDLRTMRDEAEPMRKTLAQALDLRMDNAAPSAPGGPAPAARGDTTGL